MDPRSFPLSTVQQSAGQALQCRRTYGRARGGGRGCGGGGGICNSIQPSKPLNFSHAAQTCLPAQVDPGVRVYHVLWDAYEHPAAPPSAVPRACPDGYEQVRICIPCLYPLLCTQEQSCDLRMDT